MDGGEQNLIELKRKSVECFCPLMYVLHIVKCTNTLTLKVTYLQDIVPEFKVIWIKNSGSMLTKVM